MNTRCWHCKRDATTELVVLPNGERDRLCPDCLWHYANMGWVDDTSEAVATVHPQAQSRV
jgi:hypothetical protein